MKTQLQMFYDSQQSNARKYHAFLLMALDPVEPLTKRDLVAGWRATSAPTNPTDDCGLSPHEIPKV